MNKEFIPYSEALELKELGFDENCFRGYMFQYGEWIISDMMHDNICPLYAPLYQQAFRWFRDKYNYQHIVQYFEGTYFSCVRDSNTWSADRYDTYEEAELACLKKLIEIAKNK